MLDDIRVDCWNHLRMGMSERSANFLGEQLVKWVGDGQMRVLMLRNSRELEDKLKAILFRCTISNSSTN